MKQWFFLLALILSACGVPSADSESQIVNVYATPAAQPWLTELYTCAENSEVVLRIDATAPDVFLRLGQPVDFALPAYQIDQEEILVVTHHESLVQDLTLEEVRELFTYGSASTQVWVYPSDADLQTVFDQLAMQEGGVITSSAKIALSPQHMSDVLNSESNAVGILPRHSLIGNMREVFSAGVVPVLAITKQAPQGVVADLVSCLQSN